MINLIQHNWELSLFVWFVGYCFTHGVFGQYGALTRSSGLDFCLAVGWPLFWPGYVAYMMGDTLKCLIGRVNDYETEHYRRVECKDGQN